MRARLLGSLILGAIAAAIVVIYDDKRRSCGAGGAQRPGSHPDGHVQPGVRVRRASPCSWPSSCSCSPRCWARRRRPGRRRPGVRQRPGRGAAAARARDGNRSWRPPHRPRRPAAAHRPARAPIPWPGRHLDRARARDRRHGARGDARHPDPRPRGGPVGDRHVAAADRRGGHGGRAGSAVITGPGPGTPGGTGSGAPGRGPAHPAGRGSGGAPWPCGRRLPGREGGRALAGPCRHRPPHVRPHPGAGDSGGNRGHAPTVRHHP